MKLLSVLVLFVVLLWDTADCMSAADKQVILDLHNNYRAGVNPTASDMVKMYWDDELTRKIEGHIAKCPTYHDSGDDRKIKGWGVNVGQNLAYGQKSWTEVIDAWYGEVKDFQYGYGSYTGGAILHYTQVVHGTAARVGCAFKECPGTRYGTFFGCNYVYGQMDGKKPYTQGAQGASCGKCSSSCRNNLCDCGGKICKNGGEMDVGSCTCKCDGIWAGPDCSTKNCPPSDDKDKCGSQWGFQPHHCREWMNVPGECPHMCGMCD